MLSSIIIKQASWNPHKIRAIDRSTVMMTTAAIMETTPRDSVASPAATTRQENEAELLPQADVIVAIEQRRQSGDEGQMAPELCAMLVVYIMQS